MVPLTVEVPTGLGQNKHRLTHLPYASWCPACVAHGAGSDRHGRSGEPHSGLVPTISYDDFFTKSDCQPGQDGDPDTITALIVGDSHTNFELHHYGRESAIGPCQS